MISIDAHNLRILMDINSLQSFGAVQSFAEKNATSSSLFSSMLDNVLGQSSTSGTMLGILENQRGLPVSNQSSFNQSTLPIYPTQNTNLVAGYAKGTTSKNAQYEDIIKEAAEQYNLPSHLISSVIQHESNFNSNSVSHAGAQGLMQLMPGTAKFLGVADSFDPAQNIKGGAKYLRQMLNQFDDNIELALAAYNAGPGNVRKHNGIPPFKETQNYVQKVLNTYNA